MSSVIGNFIRVSSLDYNTSMDPVSKYRVSTPQALIDTDFEYGLQAVKWETIQQVANVPTIFSRTGDAPVPITNVQIRSNSDYAYVTLPTSNTLFTPGAPFVISGLVAGFLTCEGTFIVNKLVTPFVFAYRTKQIQNSTLSIFDPNATAMYQGYFYAASMYTLDYITSITTDSNIPSTLTVNTLYPHGFNQGTQFTLVNSFGRKQYVIDTSLSSASICNVYIPTTNSSNSFILYPNFDVCDNTMLTYSNVSGTAISNLPGIIGGSYITGSNYLGTGSNVYVYNSTGYSFQLSTIPLTSNATPIQTNYLLSFTSNGIFPCSNMFYSSDLASDSALYTMCNVVSSAIGTFSTQIQLTPPNSNQIVPNSITFLPKSTVNTQYNCLTFNVPHRQASGAPIGYSNLGNQSILYSNTSVGLSNFNFTNSNVASNLYYAIRLDGYSLQLTTTPQYTAPYSNIISLDYPASNGLFIGQNGAFNGSNIVTFLSITGETYGQGTMSIPTLTTSNTIYSSSLVNTIFRTGDTVRIEVPGVSNFYTTTSFTASTLPSTPGVISFTPTGPTTSNYAYLMSNAGAVSTIYTNYVSSGVTTGFTPNQFYYLRTITPLTNPPTFYVYNRYTDAAYNTTSNGLFIPATPTGTLTFNVVTPGITYEAPVAFIGGSNKFNSTVPFSNIGTFAFNNYTYPNSNAFTSNATVLYPNFASNIGVSNMRYFVRTGLYPRTDGFNIHRAYDGGIELIPPRCTDGQVIRQTRRYFRYQPGKGIQISFSTNFSAPLEIDKMFTSNVNSSQAIVITKTVHRLTSNIPIIIDFIGQTSANILGQPASGGTYPQNPLYPWTAPSNVTIPGIVGQSNYGLYYTSPVGVYYINNVINANTFSFTMNGTPAQYGFTSNTGNNTLNASSSNYVTAPGLPIIYIPSWSNARLRCGLFDDQNGMFFEYDGSNLYAVRREAVTQLTGQSYVQFGNALVQGQINYSQNTINTTYTSQLARGSNIVIRGQSYRVAAVINDSNIYIQPPYRGTTSSNIIISIITDYRTPQSQWNIDPCDGTGPTGYVFDIHKIQMVYLDYSWYGAGKIRYGFKDNQGRVRYIHEFIHNNNAIRAFMRSGNLPARYEAINVGAPNWVPSLMHWGVSAIMDGNYDDDKAYLFTAPANIIQYNNGDSITFVGSAGSNYGVAPWNVNNPSSNYYLYNIGNPYNVQNAASNNTFFGITAVNQSIPDINTPTTFYDAYSQSTVTGYSLFTTAQTASNAPYLPNVNNSNLYLSNLPLLIQNNVTFKDVQNIRSGTSIFGCNIAPGTTTVGTPQRGNASGYFASLGQVQYTGQIFINKPVLSPFLASQITLGLPGSDLIPALIPLVSIRLSPSVDSSITGLLGVREIINKMQLRMRSIDLLTTNDTECRIYLNSTIDNPLWTPSTTPSLAQIIKHNKGDQITGGVLIYSFRVNGGLTDSSGKRSTSVNTQDLQLLGSIQNSILAGNNVYPDGPDIITVVAVCLDTAGVSATTPYIVSSRISWSEAQA